MSDITDAGPRLAAMNAALTGFDEMRAEIERLRLTDAEREAVERAIKETMCFGNPNNAIVPLDLLRGLLERLGGER